MSQCCNSISRVQVNRKHERLQSEMERLSAVLPAVEAAAGRARDAIEPNLRRNTRHALDLRDYDRQVIVLHLTYLPTKISVKISVTVDSAA